ncbi:MAG: penicillin-binding protein 1C [Burkholderiales bacterium]|nr:penicillin-binding protein 1C [Burkholderiales bacterium]
MRGQHLSSEAVLLDRHGQLLHEMRVDMLGRRLDWATLDQVSPSFLRAVVRAEDKRFYEHDGVDWLALTDAVIDGMFSDRPRGASTLSMQVAAMLEQSLRARKAHRTVGQKWDQIQAARQLERHWSKRQILEAYLNLSTFRGEVQGIGAAARALFGKDASGLDERESLLLAVLLRGPNAKPDVVAKRACALAVTMQAATACEALEALARTQLVGVPDIAPRATLAPHVARQLLSKDRRRAVTTLDAGIQALALEAAERQLSALSGRNVANAAVLVLDNRSAEVLAYVGNAGTAPTGRYVDGVRAARQAGSTLKPFLYELAIGQRLLTAASLLDDSAVNIVTPGGLYVPQNYDRSFKGLVSLRTALAASLNVPAVRTLTLMGLDLLVDRLRAVGFTSLRQDGDYYGYSLALGSPEVTLWELAGAYRTLAAGGLRRNPTLVPGAGERGARVLDAGAASIVTDILSDRSARSTTFGLDNPLAPRHWAAVKTGTSKDMRDNWCVGFTSHYTVAVWVGNFDGSPMWDVSGISGAAPLWLELVNALHRNLPSTPPALPGGVERVHVVFEGVPEPEREELFLSGTEAARVVYKAGAAAAQARIVYPADGQIVALDSDIPAHLQRMRFRAQGGERQRLHWRLNDRPAPDDGLWEPAPGQWSLSLVDEAGMLRDQIRFEVRGSAVDGAGRASVDSGEFTGHP